MLIPVWPVTGAAAAAGPARAAAPPAHEFAPPAALAPPLASSLSATKTDSFSDPDGDGKAEPGQTITYTVTVTNNGPDDATGVTFTDTVDPNTTLVPGSVNTQPLARNDSYNVLGNVRIQPNAAAGLLANDCDPDNGGPCSSAGLSASGPSASAAGGDVSINTDGSFSYNPPPGYEGPDSFTYTVTDAGGQADTATVNLTVSEVVWFVNNAAPAGGDGRLTSPYNTLAPLGGTDLDEPFDFIFVHEGSGAYNGGIVLEDNQRLVGQGSGLDAALALFGVAAPAHSDVRPAATSRPTLANSGGDVITLASGNAVLHLNASATAAASSAIFGGSGGANSVSHVGASAAGAAFGVALSNPGGAFSMSNSSVNSSSTGTAVRVDGGSQPVTFSATSVSQNGGHVVVVQNRGGGAVSFDAASSVTGTNGAADAVRLLSNAGSVTFAGPVQINTTAGGARGLVADSGTISLTHAGNAVSAMNGPAVDIENLTANVNFATTFSTGSTTRGLRVVNVTGSASFGNTTVNGSANTGVLLTDNAAAVSFIDLDIAPAPGVRGLHATDNAGAISSASGVIATTGAGVAVEIDGPAGRTPLNMQLTSVSADGAAGGISVRDASDGGNGFRVVGVGTTDGSGGTIQNISNRGASFVNADDIALSNMTFTNVGTVNGVDPTVPAGTCGSLQVGSNTGCSAGLHADGVTGLTLNNVDLTTGAQQGVNGNNVTNFSMSDSSVSGFGNEVNESGVRINNLLGASSLTNVHVFNNSTTQVEVQNDAGTLTSFNVSNSEFNHGGTAVTNGTDGLLFSGQGAAVMNINVQSSNFHDTGSGGFFSDSSGTSTVKVTIQSSTFERFGSIPVTVAKAGGANVTFNIVGNTIRDAGRAASGFGHGININKASPSLAGTTIQGTISGNTIGEAADTADADDKGSGIRIIGSSQGSVVAAVVNNNIQDFRERGILAQMLQENTGNNSMALHITNNIVSLPETIADHGILVQGGSVTGDNGTLCANVTGNNSSTAGASNGIRLRAMASTTFVLPGYAGPANDTLQLTGFVAANNPATTDTVSAARTAATATMTGGGPCATPIASVEPTADPFATGADMQTAGVKAAPADAAAEVAEAPAVAPASGSFADALRKIPAGLAHAVRGQLLGLGFGEEAPRAVAAPAALAAVSGGNVSINIGTLPAGESVTITFQVTVANPFPSNVTPPQVSNQGTVTAAGGISVLTDDPSEAGANDPTVTPILAPPTIKVNDATAAEPATGSADMAFTVSLSHPYTQTVTVNFQTANGGANPATAGSDYTDTNGTATFLAGQTVQTVSVPVPADGTAAEGDETFIVNLSGATNGVIADGQAVGTITDESVASQLIISELRTNGTNGSADDFVELLNTTDADITVQATDGSGSGWALVKRGSDCDATPVVVGVIPEGAVIPARGNYLFTGEGYSLGAYATGDAPLTADVGNSDNVGLFSTASLTNVSSVNRLDAVGFGGNTGGNCALLREGTTLTPNPGFSVDYSFVRKVTKGATQDTSDNAADFIAVDTNGTVIGGSQNLGAPGPEGSTSPRGPVPCSAQAGAAKFGRALIDPSVGAASAPNVARNTASDPANNSTFGTIDFRRTFTNNTGALVTRLRFRITNLTTFPEPSGTADLRARTSTSVVVATGAGNKTVLGTTLETDAAQPNGGGINSSLSAGTVTLATPLANGASVNLRFLFGVQQTGDYDIGVVLESLPTASGKDFWRMTGHTEDGGHTDAGCNRPPVAAAGQDQTLECDGGQATATLDGSGSSDPDGDTPLTYEWTENGTPLGTGESITASLPVGSHTITLEVTDPSGDSSTDTVVVNVVDTVGPVVTAPSPVTVYTGPGADSCGATVDDAALGTASATDACQGDVTPQRSGVPAGNFFPVGTTEVTYTATDAAGNTGWAKQVVTVIDNTKPVVTPPANITQPADPNSCSADINPGTATATDNCSVQSVVGTRSDNQDLDDPYPVGTTVITWTATDASGNTATAQQTVTVVDTQAPTLTSSVAVTTMGPPFNHALINVGLSASATDNCPILGPLQVFVYSDEDDGAAPHSPDATNIGLGSLRLRRERNGGSNGRVYLVVVKVADAAGNTSASCSTVTVPLSNSAGDVNSANAQAASAASFCSANGGSAPAGFFAVGP